METPSLKQHKFVGNHSMNIHTMFGFNLPSGFRAICHMTFIFLIRVVSHTYMSLFSGGLYPSAEKLGHISIPRGSLGGMGGGCSLNL
jgi:hypothetical protein